MQQARILNVWLGLRPMEYIFGPATAASVCPWSLSLPLSLSRALPCSMMRNAQRCAIIFIQSSVNRADVIVCWYFSKVSSARIAFSVGQSVFTQIKFSALAGRASAGKQESSLIQLLVKHTTAGHLCIYDQQAYDHDGLLENASADQSCPSFLAQLFFYGTLKRKKSNSTVPISKGAE